MRKLKKWMDFWILKVLNLFLNFSSMEKCVFYPRRTLSMKFSKKKFISINSSRFLQVLSSLKEFLEKQQKKTRKTASTFQYDFFFKILMLDVCRWLKTRFFFLWKLKNQFKTLKSQEFIPFFKFPNNFLRIMTVQLNIF